MLTLLEAATTKATEAPMPEAPTDISEAKASREPQTRAALAEARYSSFLQTATDVHKGKYSYGRLSEKDERGRVKIVCPLHGVFWQLRQAHLRGSGCKQCSAKARTTTVEDFIARSETVHGKARFDYSQVKQFARTSEQVAIICQQHGIFRQAARDHMRGVGCPQCAIDRSRKSFSGFLAEARVTHGELYDYVEESWGVEEGFVLVVCSEHGEFRQRQWNHVSGDGCPRCGGIISRVEKRFGEALATRLPLLTVDYNCRSAIPPYEIDVYFPELKLGFEFNGVYWHSKMDWARDLTEETQLSKETLKSALCRQAGISLLHVWEDDWIEAPEFWLEAIVELCSNVQTDLLKERLQLQEESSKESLQESATRMEVDSRIAELHLIAAANTEKASKVYARRMS